MFTAQRLPLEQSTHQKMSPMSSPHNTGEPKKTDLQFNLGSGHFSKTNGLISKVSARVCCPSPPTGMLSVRNWMMTDSFSLAILPDFIISFRYSKNIRNPDKSRMSEAEMACL